VERRLRAVGLCLHCRHSRRIESARESTFWLCQLSVTDVRFPKYPRIPVVRCDGYDPRPQNPGPP